jgi:hypothetical protein
MERALEDFFMLFLRVTWWLFQLFMQLLGIGLGAARNRMAKGGPYQPPQLILSPEDEAKIIKAGKQKMPVPTWLVVALTFGGCAVSAWLNSTFGCILGLVILFGGIFGYFYMSMTSQETPAPTVRPVNLETAPIYQLQVPRELTFDPALSKTFMSQLLEAFGSLVFQIVAEPGRVVWQIIDWDTLVEPEDMSRTLRRLYPDLDISVTTRQTPKLPIYRYSLHYTHGLMYPAPIAEIDDLKGSDPLIPITQGMSDLQEGERIVYTLSVAGPAYGAGVVGEGLITVSNIHPVEYANIWTAAGAEMRRSSQADRGPAFVERLQRVLTNKLNSRLFHALLSVDIEAADPNRVASLAFSILPAVQFEKPEFNGLVPATEPTLQAHQVSDAASYHSQSAIGRLVNWATGADGWPQRLLILSESELAALWHLPNQDFTSEEIAWVKGRQVPVPKAIAQIQEGVVIGSGRAGGDMAPVYLSPFARTSHMLTVGRTGYGKSTFLHNLIHQDIAAGNGVAVLDPHGDLVADILRCSIPPEREKDLVIWDLSDREYPPPLNLFAVPEGLEPTIITDQVVGVFEHAYSGFSGTRMAETLSGVLSTLARDPEATPRDAARLFNDTDYRASLNHDDLDEVGEFWQDWENLNDREQTNRADPIRWRMRQFYTSSLLRPVFCNPTPFNLRRMISENQILLFSLKDPKNMNLTEQNERMMGAMLIALFQMHAMSGATTKPFYVYIDEAQNFTTSALADVFNEARKRQLYLTLSHQTLQQLDTEKLQAAVLGNVGAMVAFCVGDDAAKLAKFLTPSFTDRQLRDLPPYQAAVKLKHEK